MKARMIRLSAAALAVAVLALAFASASFAQSSSVEAYGGSGGKIQSQVSGSAPSDPSDSGSLPFTGLDLGLALGGGLVLLVAGALIARLTPRGERVS